MTVFALINRDTHLKKSAYSYLILASLSGLCNALILAIINITADNVSAIQYNNQILYFLVFFIFAVATYCLAQQQLMLRFSSHIEQMLNDIRLTIISHIRQCDFHDIEEINSERIYITLSKELEIISQSSQLLVTGGQVSILLLFLLLYVLWLSVAAFIVLLACFSIGILLHLHDLKKTNNNIETSFKYENRIIARLMDILKGFREIKLNRKRANAIHSLYNKDSAALTASRKKVKSSYINNFVMSQASYLSIIGTIVFIIPIIFTVDPETVLKLTVALLFMAGPISIIISTVPIYTDANAAAKNIFQLEADLASHQKVNSDANILTDFNEIKLKDVSFSYKKSQDEKLFEVGPLDFTLKKGKTVIITGSNGSGKTTLIHLLTGLYHPKKGAISIDGRQVIDAELDAFRNLFTSVFSDFHLFQHLYGIDEYSQEEAEEWFEFLEISEKVYLNNNRFSNVDLSTGQKKRLALLSCILENRPIFILDEWAADQDPEFRSKFYHQILPRLKAANKTIVAISHDDKYFHLADTQIKMADGKIIEVNELDSATPTPSNISPDNTENKDC
ncbi:cyclic peptide export ABC transporter [uncultured Shewanella sp.]|uniref:cyclic peptide export ABC transporter n=1 Tax=uncultured Shewanella sp. TaxID=173975 RepID=UPI002633E93D|nr:cyclic peptide export ABC transporter [uncultured Shewanella sp.]